MSRSATRLAWYRLRATFHRRLGGYLTSAVLSAVPEPVIPAASIILAAAAALILANLVAAVPGRQAARTPAALMLGAE